MKTKEKQTLRKTAPAELSAQIGDLEKSLGKMRIDRYTKETKNTRERKTMRKKIAVMKTFIKEQSAV